MFYLRDGLRSPRLAVCFCLACLPATFTGGNLIQSSAITDAVAHSLGIDRLYIGLVTAGLVGLTMLGGINRIAHLSTVLVPVMSLFYLGSGIWVLLTHIDALPQALASIFQSALTPSSAYSGVGGWSVFSAIRYGVARGVFTNEAGLGTCAIAHGAANVEHPTRQGMWGIFEVFCSSFLVCTITALVILVSGVYPATEFTGLALTNAAFESSFGIYGSSIVSITLLLFAFSSLIGWSYYGQQALSYLCENNHFLPLYRLVFLFCIILGSLWDSNLLWALVDLCNAFLAIPNLIALALLSPQALELLWQWEHLQLSKTKRER